MFVQSLLAGQRQKLVVYGTSLTEYGAWVTQLAGHLEQRFPQQVTLVNSGKGAMCSTWGVEHFDELVLHYVPDAVFIEFAINDAYLPYQVSLRQCRANLEYMICRLKENLPRGDIILLTMNHPVGVHFNARPSIEQYYQVYRQVALERQLILIDTYPAWKQILNQDRALFDRYVPDGIHPGPEGYAQVTVPLIMRTLFAAGVMSV